MRVQKYAVTKIYVFDAAIRVRETFLVKAVKVLKNQNLATKSWHAHVEYVFVCL